METLAPMLVPMAGFWDTIMAPLHWAVSGLLVLAYNILSPVFGPDSGITWVLAIIVLTIVIRTLLIPLFVKQIRSSRNMMTLQPKVRELQKKYAHDREKLGQETMKMYKEEGVNPMASCFPLLLQMPIFFALFQVINGAARNNIKGAFMTPELAALLREATVFGAPLAGTFLPMDAFGATQIVALVLILAMVGSQFYVQLQLSAKNMPPEAMTGPMAQQQKMMLYLFPIIFGIGGVAFPIGLLIYWTASNLWSMGQQFYVIRQSPTPGTPAYAAWEARMRMKGHDPSTFKPGQKPPRATEVPAAVETVEATGDDASTTGTQPERPRVQRQQPRRQPRSNRKK